MLCAIARLLESIQDLNFRFGIQTKVQQGLKIRGLKMCDFALDPKTVKMVQKSVPERATLHDEQQK